MLPFHPPRERPGLPRRGHPLTPDFAFFPVGPYSLRDVIRGRLAPVSTVGSANIRMSSGRRWGPCVEFTSASASNYFSLGYNGSNLILPTLGCTILLHHRKTDGTNRDSHPFGVAVTDNNQRCNVHLPFVDGVVYWDYGDISGNNRISVGGLSFGDDLWAFAAGGAGMQIWQRYNYGMPILRASSTIGVSRVSTTNDFRLGGSVNTSDLAENAFLYVYRRQLPPAAITAALINPFCWMESGTLSVVPQSAVAPPPAERVPPAAVRLWR